MFDFTFLVLTKGAWISLSLFYSYQPHSDIFEYFHRCQEFIFLSNIISCNFLITLELSISAFLQIMDQLLLNHNPQSLLFWLISHIKNLKVWDLDDKFQALLILLALKEARIDNLWLHPRKTCWSMSNLIKINYEWLSFIIIHHNTISAFTFYNFM